MSINEFILKRIKGIMLERSLTTYGLVKLCDYPSSTVFNYISGNRQIPMLFVEAFCNGVGIRISTFFEGYDAPGDQSSGDCEAPFIEQ